MSERGSNIQYEYVGVTCGFSIQYEYAPCMVTCLNHEQRLSIRGGTRLTYITHPAIYSRISCQISVTSSSDELKNTTSIMEQCQS